jgi:hypothetical protein
MGFVYETYPQGLTNTIRHTLVNPFQSNFSATRILPSPYLFCAGKRLVDYLSVLHEEKHQTGSDSGAGDQTQQKNVSDVFQHWSGTGKS